MNYANFNILPELKDCLPNASADEIRDLRESIIENGIHTPLKRCQFENRDGIYLLDGHRRYGISRELGKECPVEDDSKIVIFSDVDAAIKWIIKNQFTHRTVNPLQRETIIGQYYNTIKKSHGGNRTSIDQSDRLKDSAEIAAELFKVGPATVKRLGKKSELLKQTGLDAAVWSGQISKIEMNALKELHEQIKQSQQNPEEITQNAIARAQANKGRFTSISKPSKSVLKKQTASEVEQITDTPDDHVEISPEAELTGTETIVSTLQHRIEDPASFVSVENDEISNQSDPEIQNENWIGVFEAKEKQFVLENDRPKDPIEIAFNELRELDKMALKIEMKLLKCKIDPARGDEGCGIIANISTVLDSISSFLSQSPKKRKITDLFHAVNAQTCN